MAVGVLLLNDWVLKPGGASWWTGKLSDFAGLFAFATFWEALVPRRRAAVCVSVGLGFLIWKSPLSDPVLAAWNALDVWPLTRVVDYTDWCALAVLIPVYRAHADGGRTSAPTLARRIGAVATAAVAIVAFSATSVARPVPIPNSPSFTLAGTRPMIRTALDSLGFRPIFRRPNAQSAETLQVHVRHPPERWLSVYVELRDEPVGAAAFRIVYIPGPADGPRPSNETVFRAFDAQVVAPVRQWLAGRSHPGDTLRSTTAQAPR
jgi:hypothetical protein